MPSPDTLAPIRIFLLGGLKIEWNGEPFPFKAPIKTRALLAYLLLHRGLPVHRDTIAFTLWPDQAESKARANLRRHLYRLQAALPDSGVEWVLRQGKNIVWNEDLALDLDITTLTQLPPDRAVDHYIGELLPEIYEGWLDPHRREFAVLHRDALGQLVETALPESAVSYAQRLLQLDPLNEDVIRKLMRLQVVLGQRPAALQTYDNFARQLADELGVPPMEETRRLHTDIVTGRVDSAAQPGPAAAERPRHNLPAPISPFFGRAAELTFITENLAGGHQRLLTITGPGGIGKTRLALEVARGLVDLTPNPFGGGIHMVDLSALRSTANLLETIVREIGLQPEGGDLGMALRAHLHGRKVLLLLDNLEQIPDAGLIIAHMLSENPGLSVMATSRSPLHVHGEQEYPLNPFPLPGGDPPSEPGELLGYAAVALFHARARNFNPHFTLSHENAGYIVAICRRLEGMPLAIELAASRTRIFSLPALLEELQRGFDSLTTRASDVPDRHRTLWQAIAWSSELLAPNERIFFYRLSVFPGGFTPEAAAAVALPDTPPALVLDALELLLDKSMIHRESAAADSFRFRMLHPVREFALARFRESADPEVFARRTAYFVDFAEQLDVGLRGDSQAIWLDRADLEAENLRAILVHALEIDELEQAMRLCIALVRFWALRGQLVEGRRWMESLLAGRHPQPTVEWAGLLRALGWTAMRLGDYTISIEYYEKSLEILDLLGDQLGKAGALLDLGLVREMGNIGSPAAEEIYTEALYLYEAQEDITGLARAHNRLGATAYYRMDFSQAREHWEATLWYYRQMGNAADVMNALNNLGVAAYAQGQYEEARSLHTDVLAQREKSDYRGRLSQSHVNLGMSLLRLGDHAAALEHAKQGIATGQAMGLKPSVIENLELVGMVAAAAGDPLLGARLLGAVDALRDAFKAGRDAVQEADRTWARENLQARTDEDLERLTDQGKRLNIERAVELAGSVELIGSR